MTLYSLEMNRPAITQKISAAFELHPVVGLLGPRQCGKTTVARRFAESLKKEAITTFDLENPTDLMRLEQPKLALQDLKGWVIIDEIQKRPELFPLLRVLADRPGKPARFLILSSASKELLRQSSESLAGRIAYLELTPFNSRETQDPTSLWLRGGYVGLNAYLGIGSS
jgi:predicted AAA+ superfamily ATPase